VATDPDAEAVYRAEAILERELPTRKLDLADAQALVDQISHAEDIDPPKVLHLPISDQYDALAVPSEQVIVVRTHRTPQLTILHEIAHFLGDSDHGVQFREAYLKLIGQYISYAHQSRLREALE
jgi:hypothetical protein